MATRLLSISDDVYFETLFKRYLQTTGEERNITAIWYDRSEDKVYVKFDDGSNSIFDNDGFANWCLHSKDPDLARLFNVDWPRVGINGGVSI